MNLNATKLHPYSALCECPKCGNRDHSSDKTVEHACFHIRTRYCAGGKDLEEHKPANPMAIIGGMMEAAGEGRNLTTDMLTKTEINLCAGIGEEHLHKVCSSCGFEWMTGTKDSAQQSALSSQPVPGLQACTCPLGRTLDRSMVLDCPMHGREATA